MPTTTSAKQESDSEDLDYVPEDHGMTSSRTMSYSPLSTPSVSDSDNSEERNAKRPRIGHEGPPSTQEELPINKRCGIIFLNETFLDKRSERQALWAKFQASVSTPTPKAPGSGPKRMVTIEKRHRFAGEDVV
jgi:hypothetical protein